jgi:predicted N-acyltransferase
MKRKEEKKETTKSGRLNWMAGKQICMNASTQIFKFYGMVKTKSLSFMGW